MRPHKMNEAGALAPDMSVSLFVRRDCGSGLWRLAWWRKGADAFVMAEGECSAKHFRTIAGARGYGVANYGERAAYCREFAN